MNSYDAQEHQEYSGIQLTCHQSQFVGSISSALRFLWSGNPDAAEFQKELHSELIELRDSWSFRFGEWWPDRYNLAYQFIYDPDAKRISIAPYKDEDISADPSDYPNKLRSTSELLRLDDAIKHSVIHDYDLTPAQQSYPIMKLTLALLDNDFRIDNIRVNSNDAEEWDYINLVADREFAHRMAEYGN